MDTMTTVNTGTRLSSAHAPWVKSAQMSMGADWALGAGDRSKRGVAAYRMPVGADQENPVIADAPSFVGRAASTSKIADQADHRGFDATVSTFSTRLGLSSGSPPV